MSRADLKLTYEEYRTLPEMGPRYQLVEGKLVLTPAPTLRHQKIAARLFSALYAFVEPRRLGLVLFAPVDVILSDTDVVQPDILYVSSDRQGILIPEGVRGAPDLCVEVLSESTKDLDRGAKRVLFAKYGVVEYWLVDAAANSVEAFRLQEESSSATVSFAEGENLTTALLPGFRIDVGTLLAP